MAVPVHEPVHAVQGLLELLVRGGIAGAHEPLAAGAERIARHDRHMLLLQELLAEELVVHAGGRDVREGIEGAARLEGLEAKPVQSIHQQPAAAVVLREHFLHIALADRQRLDGGILRGRGRGHDRVLVDAHHALNDIRRTGRIPNAPAGHGVVFREAAQQDRALPDALRQRRHAHMREAIHQAVVDLVRDDQQVMLFRDASRSSAGPQGWQPRRWGCSDSQRR